MGTGSGGSALLSRVQSLRFPAAAAAHGTATPPTGAPAGRAAKTPGPVPRPSLRRSLSMGSPSGGGDDDGSVVEAELEPVESPQPPTTSPGSSFQQGLPGTPRDPWAAASGDRFEEAFRLKRMRCGRMRLFPHGALALTRPIFARSSYFARSAECPALVLPPPAAQPGAEVFDGGAGPSGKRLPRSFNVWSFLLCLDALLDADHFQVLLRALSFLYNSEALFTGRERVWLVERLLLKHRFYRLFAHWNYLVRRYFHHLIAYRIFRVARVALPCRSENEMLREAELRGRHAPPERAALVAIRDASHLRRLRGRHAATPHRDAPRHNGSASTAPRASGPVPSAAADATAPAPGASAAGAAGPEALAAPEEEGEGSQLEREVRLHLDRRQRLREMGIGRRHLRSVIFARRTTSSPNTLVRGPGAACPPTPPARPLPLPRTPLLTPASRCPGAKDDVLTVYGELERVAATSRRRSSALQILRRLPSLGSLARASTPHAQARRASIAMGAGGGDGDGLRGDPGQEGGSGNHDGMGSPADTRPTVTELRGRRSMTPPPAVARSVDSFDPGSAAAGAAGESESEGGADPGSPAEGAGDGATPQPAPALSPPAAGADAGGGVAPSPRRARKQQLRWSSSETGIGRSSVGAATRSMRGVQEAPASVAGWRRGAQGSEAPPTALRPPSPVSPGDSGGSGGSGAAHGQNAAGSKARRSPVSWPLQALRALRSQGRDEGRRTGGGAGISSPAGQAEDAGATARVFEASLKHEAAAVDLVLASKLDSFLHYCLLQSSDSETEFVPRTTWPYLHRAMDEYVVVLREYHQRFRDVAHGRRGGAAAMILPPAPEIRFNVITLGEFD